jgi:ATP-dependent Clp protease ATP-binding subunit ClpC
VSKYPQFERLTAHAKRALVCAQQEAEDGPDAYLGTEHILLGLFRVGEGSAYRALKRLGVDELRIRAERQRIRDARRPGPMPDQVIPTTRVRNVILLADEKRSSAGMGELHSGHLLVAIVLEGGGMAAKMLEAQSVDAAAVVDAVELEIARGASA